jgi:hypothetical protein
MNSKEFEEFKKELIDRFLNRYDDLIGFILDDPENDEEYKDYHMEALSNYIFHEWVAYTQALNEFDIITDEEYEELRGIDIDKEYLDMDNEQEEPNTWKPSLDLGKFGSN